MISSSFRALAVLGSIAFLLTACEDTKYKLPHDVDSFRVVVEEIQPTNAPDQTGFTEDSALPIPIDPVRLRVTVTAIDEKGDVYTAFNRPITFRATPGNVVSATLLNGETWGDRMLPAVDGVATGWVSVEKVFGEVRLWAEDAPVAPIYQTPTTDGGVAAADAGTPGYVENEAIRTYTAGVSQPIYFVKPTIADVQLVPTDPPGCQTATCKVDNKLSPFVSNFLTIDAARPRGDMIVTAITNEGFYVTDRLAQRLDRLPYSAAVGNFGSIFVYNYSYPDGLYVGDRVLSLTGTVQEFSGTTQLVFPSWVRLADDPHREDIPEPTVFDFSNADPNNPSLGYRLCKTGLKYAAAANRVNNLDLLCAYSNNNIDIESVESALVKLVNVKPSTTFVNCDRNGNSNIGLFGQTKLPDGTWSWFCFDEGEDHDDCQCYLDCVIGGGEFDGQVCTELSAFDTYGQWLVELEQNRFVRINVSTRDALPDLDPREFAKPEHAGCTLDITGIIRQTQAARPRWIVIAREETDVCCRAPEGKTCPTGVPICAQ